MSKTIKLKKGFDINLVGKPAAEIADAPQAELYAFKPTDFHHISRPKVLVHEGETVKAGQPLLFEKTMETVMYTAPVSGEVVEVKRGEKRKLLEITIKPDAEQQYAEFQKYSVSDLANLDRGAAVEQMTQAGVWPFVIQRPYGVVASPADTPKSIFISAFDTHPLAPDYGFIFKDDQEAFQAGIKVLGKFGAPIHLNVDGKGERSPFEQADGVTVNKVSGPHPAGNVGVQIHHIDPIGKGDLVWTLNPFGVIMIGRLFLEGRYNTSKLVAVAGSEVSAPKYYRTHMGVQVKSLVDGKLKQDHVRYISGNALTGYKVEKEGFLGFYDHQLSVLPEGDYYEFFGWIKPTSNKLSFHRALGLLSFLNPKKEYALDTNMRGEPRAFVMTGAFEQVVPMDILPMYLLKAVMSENFEDMEALGIYEVVEEDLALCEFIDVSKHEIQDILREGLTLLQHS